MRILVPVDGSDSSLAAVRFVIAKLASAGTPQEIHLLTVQPQLPTASRFVDAGVLRDYRQEEGAKDLAAARKLLDNAGVEYTSHIAVGDPADTIATYADQKQCDAIVMGTRGLGRVAGLVLGSVAVKVLHLAKVPVTLTK
ncbi:MAG TPA: universal stress protein [Kiloniellaceae bacterium]